MSKLLEYLCCSVSDSFTYDKTRNLHQEAAYIKLSKQFCPEFAENTYLYQNINTYDHKKKDKIQINYPVGCTVKLDRIKPTLLMSACAYQGRTDIDNILDGYSAVLFVELSSVGKDVWNMKFVQKPVEDKMFQREMSPVPEEPDRPAYCDCCYTCLPGYNPNNLPALKAVKPRNVNNCTSCGLWTGLFNGPVWCWLLLRPGRVMVDRTTAHCPIWKDGTILFASTCNFQQVKYTTATAAPYLLKVEQETESSKDVLHAEHPDFPYEKQQFFCMHNHEDNHVRFGDDKNSRMITYTFTQEKLTQQTKITFWEFGLDGQIGGKIKQKTEFLMDGFKTLHMFGYTRNYYLVFVNPLAANKLKMLCSRSPVLRALDDTFFANLVIVGVRRPNAPKHLPFSFEVDTQQQGNIYHTVNCYEEYPQVVGERPKDYLDNPIGMVIDGWASKLNAARESSQFELVQDDQHSVHENEGNLMRYRINFSHTILKDGTIDIKPTSVEVDNYIPNINSTIDFHCINPHNYGRHYRRFWLVTHLRDRVVDQKNPFGNIRRVESLIWGVTWPAKKEDPAIPPVCWSTEVHLPKEDKHGREISYYSRTPMFVARERITEHKDSDDAENDGYLFVWVYRVKHQKTHKPLEGPPVYDKIDSKTQVVKNDKPEGLDENLVRQAEPDYKTKGHLESVEQKLKARREKAKKQGEQVEELAPLSGAEDELKDDREGEGGINKGRNKLYSSKSTAAKSDAILLIFDAKDFNDQSIPIIVELGSKVIPYSVHSFTHQLAKFTPNPEEEKVVLEIVENEKKENFGGNRNEAIPKTGRGREKKPAGDRMLNKPILVGQDKDTVFIATGNTPPASVSLATGLGPDTAATTASPATSESP